MRSHLQATLCGYPRPLSYDYDWIEALRAHFDARMVDFRGKPCELDSDVIVLLHSVTAQGVKVPEWAMSKLKERRGKLVQLNGNDYKDIEGKQALADALEVDLMCSLVPNPPYHEGATKRVIHMPHAMGIAAKFGDREHDQRPIRVGFRGIKYPQDLGDSERNDAVEALMNRDGCDVQWGLFGDPLHYFRHLGMSRATCTSEGGKPGKKAITSRHFDAIGTRAALITYPGKYSGCLNSDHYVMLNKDLSNLDECLDVIDDPVQWADVTERAYTHCQVHHTYHNRMETLQSALWPV